jgi:TetR/AcrR family transcriptional repressor of mexJK operon
MARTVNQAERDARRAAILEAAIGVFARQGLEATPLAEIAAVIGVRHSTILNYFMSKDALFRAAVLEPLEQLARVLRPGPDEPLGALVGRQVGLFMAQGPYLRLTQYVLAQGERFPELAGALRAFVERLREDLEPLQVAAGATPEQAAWRFWGYFSLLLGMALVMDDTAAVREAMTERACVMLGVTPQV